MDEPSQPARGQHPLRAAYRRLGLLVWLSLISLGIAAVLHHASRLPRHYTWLEPLLTLRLVLGQPRFPVAILVVYALGIYARRGDWDPEATGRWLASDIDVGKVVMGTVLPMALRRGLVIGAIIALDAVVLQTDRDLIDVFALTAVGFVIAGYRPGGKRLAKEIAYAAIGAAVFVAICYCYTVLKALTFVSGRSFDATIVGLEAAVLGSAPHRALAVWTASHPSAAALFDWVYFHFFQHMVLTTVLLVALRKPRQRTEYLGALALCYLIGGPLYHLFPAVGPSYFEPQYYGFLDDSSLIVGGVRGWLQYNTDSVLRGSATEVRTWGYIACMPSLHVAQELVMLYHARGSLPLFLLSLAFTLLTLVAVVALGWHYPLDALAGVGVAALAIAIARSQRRVLMPAGLTAREDAQSSPPKPVLVPFLEAYRTARRRRKEAEP